METVFYTAAKTKEILNLTFVIQDQFPGLYAHLDEAPVFLSPGLQSVSQMELDEYYQSLKDQSARFMMSRDWL